MSEFAAPRVPYPAPGRRAAAGLGENRPPLGVVRPDHARLQAR